MTLREFWEQQAERVALDASVEVVQREAAIEYRLTVSGWFA